MSLVIEAGSKAVLVTTDLGDVVAEAVYIIGPDYPERLDGLPEGTYIFEGESFGFGVGAYSIYNDWRTVLSKLVLNVEAEVVWDNPEAYTGKPFVELINFADNEGAIGPKISKKLSEDFASHAENLRELVTAWEGTLVMPGDKFIELYNNFHTAFELASDNGFVVFE